MVAGSVEWPKPNSSRKSPSTRISRFCNRFSSRIPCFEASTLKVRHWPEGHAVSLAVSLDARSDGHIGLKPSPQRLGSFALSRIFSIRQKRKAKAAPSPVG